MAELTAEELENMNQESRYLNDDDDDVLNMDPSEFDRVEEDDDEEVEASAEAEDEEDEDDADKQRVRDDEDEDEDEDDEDEEPDDEEDSEEEDSEEEDVAEEDEDEKPAKAAKGKKNEDSKRDHLIPKRRYDSAKERLAAAQRELKELKQNANRKDSQEADDLSQKLYDVSEKLTEALVMGNSEEANKLRRQEIELMEMKAEFKARAVANQRVEQMRYAEKVSQMEELYPELNEDHEQFDKELSAEVVELCDAFEAMGHSPAAALDKAVSYVFPDLIPTIESSASENPAEEKAVKRKAKSIRRAKQAAKKQPKSMKGKGQNSNAQGLQGKMEFDKMTDEEFDDLDMDSEEMRIARGDYLL